MNAYLSECTITDIDYQAALIELPADVVRTTVDSIRAAQTTRLLRLTDVKYLSPMAALQATPCDLEAPPTGAQFGPPPTGEPCVGLLDGLPLANHAALQGRLAIDDPDDLAATYNAGEHRHGTSMASLIIHGELGAGGSTTTRPVYVRPVLQPGVADANGIRWERLPQGQLVPDLIHRAVRRMFDGDGGTPPQAPSVRVVNMSLGDGNQLFDRQVSPWARLVDWLSWKYRVLFVVSAGNHFDEITIPTANNAVAALSDESLRSQVLRAIAAQRMTRRLLAPAESVNALTVGAQHAQSTPIGPTGTLTDLLRGMNAASPINSLASGFRRSVKPEILAPGGAIHYSARIGGGPSTTFALSRITNQPGQMVASPGGIGIPPRNTTRDAGTSNATALTSRAAAIFFEQVQALKATPGGNQLDDGKIAVLLKAMLVHGASWGDAANLIANVFREGHWSTAKRACAQFLGYGAADFDRAILCSDQKVVVIGTAELGADEGHVYQLPLPPALGAQVVKRRLTATLAWLTPFNQRHRNYATADLWFALPEEQLQLRRLDADQTAVKRGTVQHEVLEGERAVPIAQGDMLPITVSCRAEAGRLPGRVPYALMVSLEIARPLGVDIHDQVRVALDRLRVPVAIRPAP